MQVEISSGPRICPAVPEPFLLWASFMMILDRSLTKKLLVLLEDLIGKRKGVTGLTAGVIL